MSEYMTLVFRKPISSETRDFLESAQWSVASHSHAIHDRDLLMAALDDIRAYYPNSWAADRANQAIAQVQGIQVESQPELLICTLNGFQYWLGPEAPTTMDWHEAIEWCKSLGDEYELPDRVVLLQCYFNDSIREQFQPQWYWSSTEYNANNAWYQYFGYGNQDNTSKTSNKYVRAVRKVKI